MEELKEVSSDQSPFANSRLALYNLLLVNSINKVTRSLVLPSLFSEKLPTSEAKLFALPFDKRKTCMNNVYNPSIRHHFNGGWDHLCHGQPPSSVDYSHVRLVAAGFSVSVGVGVSVSGCVKLVYLMFVWLPPTPTPTLTLTPIVVRFEDAGN
ncbi:Uncharacterized protein Rs2_43117 [Raphanus sativus]|nr:Uncharacterized protein Rs2_43117 [Raphanus sativus]